MARARILRGQNRVGLDVQGLHRFVHDLDIANASNVGPKSNVSYHAKRLTIDERWWPMGKPHLKIIDELVVPWIETDNDRIACA